MSNRTIVEFNHDAAVEIIGNEAEFSRLVLRALGSDSITDWLPLERFGIRFGVAAHHSSNRICGIKGSDGKFVHKVTF